MSEVLIGPLIFVLVMLLALMSLLFQNKLQKLVPVILVGNYIYFIFLLNYLKTINFEPYFSLNEFEVFFLCIVSVFAILVTLLNGNKDIKGRRNSVLTSFLFIGTIFLIGPKEFIAFYIGLELISLMGYALVSTSGYKYSKEAALKYFIQGSIISSFFLMGVAFFFGATGGLEFRNFEILNQDFYSIAIGLFTIVVFFKMGIFPFHSWVPDVYSNIGKGTLANLFLINKLVVGFSLITLIQSLLMRCPAGIQAAFVQIVVTLAIISAFFGNIKGLAQKQYKRMIAYSSVAHSGYMLMVLVTTVGKGYEFQLLYYLVFYSIAAAGALLIINYYLNDGKIKDEADVLKGAFYKNHLMGVLLTIFILSLSGFPLTAGFVIKYLLFINFFKDGLAAASISLLISSVIGLGYYIRIISSIFSDEDEAQSNKLNVSEMSLNVKILVFVMGILVLSGGLAPSLFMK